MVFFQKNKGYKQLQDIDNILRGDSSNIDYHGFYLNETACMEHAPITSVDVEHFFSVYKNV